uniref:Fanconi anaemia group A protein arcN subdomain domain-containing protein n=1 Tax=Branchiostoma floridae TaxID=7739 RepID=C3YLB2_BRAFL|eukprot:XP_002602837.1 hypothetical protein BRAFLDRAFT_128931 [Branchiostoma floridae]
MMPDPPLCHVADRPRPDVPPRRPFSQPACYRRKPCRQTSSYIVPPPLVVAEARKDAIPKPSAAGHVSALSCRPRRRLPDPARRLPDPARRACPTRPRSFAPRTRRCPSRPQLARDTAMNFQVRLKAYNIKESLNPTGETKGYNIEAFVELRELLEAFCAPEWEWHRPHLYTDLYRGAQGNNGGIRSQCNCSTHPGAKGILGSLISYAYTEKRGKSEEASAKGLRKMLVMLTAEDITRQLEYVVDKDQESIEESSIYEDGSTDKQGKTDRSQQAAHDVERAMAQFEKTGKVPANVIEARAEKIPGNMYTAYTEGCRREAAQLLEGVFEGDEQEELFEPVDQLRHSLEKFPAAVITSIQTASAATATNDFTPLLSVVSQRLTLVLETLPGQSSPSEVLELDISHPQLDSYLLQVVDLLLNTFCKTVAAFSATISEKPDIAASRGHISIYTMCMAWLPSYSIWDPCRLCSLKSRLLGGDVGIPGSRPGCGVAMDTQCFFRRSRDEVKAEDQQVMLAAAQIYHSGFFKQILGTEAQKELLPLVSLDQTSSQSVSRTKSHDSLLLGALSDRMDQSGQESGDMDRLTLEEQETCTFIRLCMSLPAEYLYGVSPQERFSTEALSAVAGFINTLLGALRVVTSHSASTASSNGEQWLEQLLTSSPLLTASLLAWWSRLKPLVSHQCCGFGEGQLPTPLGKIDALTQWATRSHTVVLSSTARVMKAIQELEGPMGEKVASCLLLMIMLHLSIVDFTCQESKPASSPWVKLAQSLLNTYPETLSIFTVEDIENPSAQTRLCPDRLYQLVPVMFFRTLVACPVDILQNPKFLPTALSMHVKVIGLYQSVGGEEMWGGAKATYRGQLLTLDLMGQITRILMHCLPQCSTESLRQVDMVFHLELQVRVSK